MSAAQWVLVCWITLNALIMTVRAIDGRPRTYTKSDIVFAFIESGIAIWLVTTL